MPCGLVLSLVEDVCPFDVFVALTGSRIIAVETTEYSIMTTLAQDAEVEASTASNSYNDGSTASVTNSTDEFTGGTEKRTSVADSVRSSDTGSKHTKSTSGKSRYSIPSRHSSRMSMPGLWGDFARRNSAWETDSLLSEDLEDTIACKEFCISQVESTARWLSSTLHTAFTKPSILIPSLLLFVVLVVCGVFVVYGFENATIESRKQTATSVAEQTDLFFVRVLENAFTPLFTMSMFIRELSEFHNLDLLIGDRCDPVMDPLNCTESTSAPSMPGKEETHRDLSGVFTTA